MVAFLVTFGFVVILVVGSTVISVRLKGSRQVYATRRRYTTDANISLTDVDMIYYSRRILAIMIVTLVALSTIVISAVINAIIR